MYNMHNLQTSKEIDQLVPVKVTSYINYVKQQNRFKDNLQKNSSSPVQFALQAPVMKQHA